MPKTNLSPEMEKYLSDVTDRLYAAKDKGTINDLYFIAAELINKLTVETSKELTNELSPS